MMTTAQLVSEPDVPFIRSGGYHTVIEELNSLPPSEGFIFREYSPSGLSACGHVRQYFTPTNAMRIDTIRRTIEEWYDSKAISQTEKQLLIADLLESASAIANIAGTYGCFLRSWLPAALRPLRLTARSLSSKRGDFEVTCAEALSLKGDATDVAYLDPPYTKRQYAAYYHILETIAVGDAPTIVGVTGLRPWRDKASDFCHRRRALGTLLTLTARLAAQRILVSYNSQGHIALEDLVGGLSMQGKVVLHRLAEIGRYRPSVTASRNGATVIEYAVELRKGVTSLLIPGEHIQVG